MFGKFSFSFEPVRWTEILRQAIYVAVLFGWLQWDDTKQTAVLMVVSLVLAEIARAFSVPSQTVEDAGTTIQKLKSAAVDTGRMQSGQPPAVPPSALMVALLISSLMFTACASGGKRAPVLVGQASLAAGQTIGQLQRTIQQLTRTRDEPGTIPTHVALQAQETLLRVNAKLDLVPPLLRSIDAAQQTGNPDQSQVMQAIDLLQKVSADLSIVVAGIPLSDGTKQVLALIQSGQTTITTLLVQLGKIQAQFGTARYWTPHVIIPLGEFYADDLEIAFIGQ
jgi:hypothetical protein